MIPDYRCATCGSTHRVTTGRWRCDCGAPLRLAFEPEPIDRGSLARRPTTLWRWREAIPLSEILAPSHLGAGVVPLVDDEFAGCPVHFALEYVSPTGSYKDRGACLLVAIASALGAGEVVDDSSGNAAIALAAHAARAGIRTRVFVPSDAAESKTSLASSLGAEVVRVDGGRREAADAAEREAARGAFYASHAWSPFFLHGAKTLAYNLAEALGWSAPGAVIVPSGNGGLLLGLEIGFRELRRHGLVERRPALFAVQAEACAPLWLAFRDGLLEPVPVHEGDTIADGVRVAAPPRGSEVLRAVRDTGGEVVAVDDTTIDEARRALAARGYIVEPTGALAAAALIRHGGEIRRRHGDIVAVLTGSGLKRT